MLKSLDQNKDGRMTWEELVKQYPDQWVVLSNPLKDGEDILSAVLVDVKSDDEIDKYEMDHLDKGYEYWRTTEGEFYGVIDADFSISVN